MVIHAKVMQWLERSYPKPQIDPDWLEQCYTWILSEYDDCTPDTAIGISRIIKNVEKQLLQSDLTDSTLEGTGLPVISSERTTRLNLLVQIVEIDEVGHSAFNLKNVRANRLERADLTGLNIATEGENGNVEEDEGPIPKYPRSMLRLVLSDGYRTIPAMEYRRIPEFELGATPLGYKLQLKDVDVRSGIAFLKPDNVIHKANHNYELEENQDKIFVRGLHRRLRIPFEEEEAPPAAQPQAQRLPLPQAQPQTQRQRQSPAQPDVRSPFFSEGPSDTRGAQIKQALPLPPARQAAHARDPDDEMFGDDESEWNDPELLALLDQNMPPSQPLHPQPTLVSEPDEFNMGDDSFVFDDEVLQQLDAAESIAQTLPSASQGAGRLLDTINVDSDSDNEQPRSTYKRQKRLETKVSADIIEISD